ncbi:hypothetical protein O3M35_010162 [Rhynocoris fuscipes]|uniref:H15 domain-containing protein n=1 Tax=Rhynocoris fuscipes TaxID=488301 RepID=A0AAW1CXW2_9HEMI
MTETTVEQPAVEAPASPKKKPAATKKKTGASKPAKKMATHPPTSQMVNAAIKELKERGGSSLQAIKKYISTTYTVDADKMSVFIRKYIKSAVASGDLVQTKGKGASGSFRLGGGDAPAKKSAKTAKPAAKKAKKEGTAAKKPAKEKTTSKAKKTKKPPTTPKAPKPKKATAAPKTTKSPAAKSKKKASPKKK